mgnify:CR=1 FL=1
MTVSVSNITQRFVSGVGGVGGGVTIKRTALSVSSIYFGDACFSHIM